VDRYKQLAVQLKTNPDNSMFSSVEPQMIGTAQKNTKAYEKRSLSIEKRFFETLRLHGKELATLCEIEVWDDGLQNDHRFYNIVGGEKEEWKKTAPQPFSHSICASIGEQEKPGQTT
jgi:hypothetical protein